VKALSALARIHSELPALEARKVLAGPREQWDEPTTWVDLVEDPITVVSADYEDEASQLLPAIANELEQTWLGKLVRPKQKGEHRL